MAGAQKWWAQGALALHIPGDNVSHGGWQNGGGTEGEGLGPGLVCFWRFCVL